MDGGELAAQVFAEVQKLRESVPNSQRAAFVVRPAYALLYPIVKPLQLLLRRVDSLQLVTDEEREDEQEEEVEAFIEAGEREGLLEANEGEMVRSIVDLDETRVDGSSAVS